MSMSTSYLSLFTVLCCIFLRASINEANEANKLREFIKNERSSGSSSPENLLLLDFLSSKSFSPVYISPHEGMMDSDKIGELPGQPTGVDFNQYAGYVTVDPNHGRALFYYFVESPKNSSCKPLVLWLNGGPGCSSLGYGAMEELGPFRVNSDGETLTRNYYAWNNVANILFLESPAGVGFSYSNTSSDIHQSGDKRTAVDSYAFLINWLERFPQYKARDFYIAGESYAGHYIPELAQLILENNKITNQTSINLHGVAIGNAYIDRTSNRIGTIAYYWTHALISDDTYDMIRSTCNFSNPFYSVKCKDALSKADNEIGDIDFYNIYAPLCHDTKSSSGVSMADFDPCSDNYVHKYLNNPLVQKAFHANVTKLSSDWESCRDLSWIDEHPTVLPIVIELITSGIRFWLYSGDIDSVVPITSTRYSIKILGLPIKNSWRPWYLNEEVGGYVEEYEGLTLATVRGAGHMAPSNQPERSLAMFSSFLQGQLPPKMHK